MTTQINPFYPVLRNQLSTQFITDEGVTEDVDVERDVLLNGENGQLLGTVGRIYKLITNQEVEDVFSEAFSDLPITEIDDHLSWKQNKWQRDYILDGDDFNIVVGGEVVQTKISIWNGYDGKSAVGFSVSAYRRRNNTTLLSKMFGKTYSHVHCELVDRIRDDFTTQLRKFQDMTALFDQWSREVMTQQTFESFIRSNIKTDAVGNTGFLSERQADAIIDSYEGHLIRCGVGNTRWGAYNVLASIAANDVTGRGGSSNVFTQGYKRMERLSKNFFEFDGEDLFTI